MGKGHAKRLLESGAQISCVCDKSRAAREAFCEEIPQENIQEYDDFDKMLDEGDFDVLFICLPPFAQDHQFERAAERGKHIFIEKPIALNTETGKRMVESAANSGIITRVGFHMRPGLSLIHT